MKDMIFTGLMYFTMGLLAPITARSQGTLTYVSSLEQPSAGSELVGSDSWLAALVLTGNNPGGYVLDSVQLAMTPASGAPGDFEVSLYAPRFNALGIVGPGSSLGTLSGSSDPAAGGLYTYTASCLALSPETFYFIGLTAGSAVATGAYAWSFGTSAPMITGGWGGTDLFVSSNDGSSWSQTSDDPQFALTATAVPEPDALALLGLSGLLFFTLRRRHAKVLAAISR